MTPSRTLPDPPLPASISGGTPPHDAALSSLSPLAPSPCSAALPNPSLTFEPDTRRRRRRACPHLRPPRAPPTLPRGAPRRPLHPRPGNRWREAAIRPHRPLLPRLRPPCPSTDASPSGHPGPCRPPQHALGELQVLVHHSSLSLPLLYRTSPCTAAVLRRGHGRRPSGDHKVQCLRSPCSP